jgi:hypothetical protein
MKFYLERYIHANNFLFQLCYLKVEFKLYYALIIWVCYLFDFVYYALKQLPREKIQLATKFGISRGQGSGFTGMTIKGSPDYVCSCCEASLKRLGVEYIDLYYQNRVDTSVPIEDTVKDFFLCQTCILFQHLFVTTHYIIHFSSYWYAYIIWWESHIIWDMIWP